MKAIGTDRIRVMLSTEGTYPFHKGGVSTWCNVLVGQLASIDYVLFAIVMNPYVSQKFTVPGRVGMIKVPLWGTEEPSEHLSGPFSQVYLAKKRTDQTVVQGNFLPLFKELIEEIISPRKMPLRFGRTLLEIHKYLREYDYKNSFKSEVVWNSFKEMVLRYAADPGNQLAAPSVFDLIQSLGWIYRFLTILNTPLPRVDVAHSVAAAFCGIPCAMAKLENGTPFLLTEHGVYMREMYLSLAVRGYSSYLSTFLVRMVHSVSGLSYALADQVSPVCAYNTRWEKVLGVVPESIKVIYNGVDQNVFVPEGGSHHGSRPTVVCVARIDPVKDLITLMRAAVLVREKIPDVRFIVFGSVTVESYYEECLAAREQLGLQDTFIFAGHTDDVPAAYRTGDVVALSSITEAFPYSVVEAMMSGRPVVATNVGGVGEALGDSGILVSPRQHEEMASALTMLLQDPATRVSLGEEARKRALDFFTVERALQLYLGSYRLLASRAGGDELAARRLARQKLLMERGYALAAGAYWREAVAQFREAVEVWTVSPAVPMLLVEIARGEFTLGHRQVAVAELRKAEAMYLGSYRLLASRTGMDELTARRLSRQKLLTEKGFALAAAAYWREAVAQFREAVEVWTDSPAVPVLLVEIARGEFILGHRKAAVAELQKAEAMSILVHEVLPA